MARPAKTQLSKHLLEMKFMKRTALRIETEAHVTEQQQQIDDDHWVLDVPDLKQRENQYIIQNSTAWCESLKWGRMAFKGFNPEIEKLMNLKNNEQDLELAEEREQEMSVSDMEMAKRYSSLVGTIHNKFSRKRKRKQSSSSESSEEEETVETIVSNKISELRSLTTTERQEEDTKVPDTQTNIDISKREKSTTLCEVKSKPNSSILKYYSKKKENKAKFLKPKDV